MGLYDHIFCEASLPWPETFTGKKAREFQTKDLDCSLLYYKIAENGRLYRVDHTYEEVPTTPEVAEQRKKTNTEWLDKCAARKLIDTTLVPMSFTGSITFYDFVHGEELDHWVEFVGLFSNGFLVKPIVQQNCTATSNKERLELEAKYLQEAKERLAYLKTWRGKLHQFVSRLVTLFFYKIYFKTLNKLIEFGYRVQRMFV